MNSSTKCGGGGWGGGIHQWIQMALSSSRLTGVKSRVSMKRVHFVTINGAKAPWAAKATPKTCVARRACSHSCMDAMLSALSWKTRSGATSENVLQVRRIQRRDDSAAEPHGIKYKCFVPNFNYTSPLQHGLRLLTASTR